MNRVPLEIFSLDILIILVVATPLALTPSLFSADPSYTHRHMGHNRFLIIHADNRFHAACECPATGKLDSGPNFQGQYTLT